MLIILGQQCLNFSTSSNTSQNINYLLAPPSLVALHNALPEPIARIKSDNDQTRGRVTATKGQAYPLRAYFGHRFCLNFKSIKTAVIHTLVFTFAV